MRQQFSDALKEAMKAGDKRRVSTVRLITSALKDRDIEQRGVGKDPLSDDEILGLLTKMEALRHFIESYLDLTLFVDAIAFGLDSGDLPLMSLVRQGSQNNLGRLAHLDFASLALVDIGEDPYLLWVDQREHWLYRGKR